MVRLVDMKELRMHTDIENGSVILPHALIHASAIPWVPHSRLAGVFLKDLVSSGETHGSFSYHLVRVERQATVPDHLHADQWEWNMILEGSGVFLMGEDEIPVKPGQSYGIPPGVNHTITAGDETLILCAFFFPDVVKNRYWGLLKERRARS